MKAMLEQKIAELEAYRAGLEAKAQHAPEFDRPEQASQARMYRDGWRQRKPSAAPPTAAARAPLRGAFSYPEQFAQSIQRLSIARL